MKIILTMAGMGTRFKGAGYQQEKHEIDFLGHSLLQWSLVSLKSFTEAQLIVITRRLPGVELFVAEAAREVGFHDPAIVFVDAPTRGQAVSACLARSVVDADDEVLIYNTDTYVVPSHLSPEMVRGDGWIPCFTADGDHWSFVEGDADGRALRVVEKNRISSNCSIGLYYFRRFGDLVKLTNLASERDDDGEIYIAPLFQEMIMAGQKVFFDLIDSDCVVPLGTPNELLLAPKSLIFPQDISGG
jgi:dTDP-glucose pyrophosphorylase